MCNTFQTYFLWRNISTKVIIAGNKCILAVQSALVSPVVHLRSKPRFYLSLSVDSVGFFKHWQKFHFHFLLNIFICKNPSTDSVTNCEPKFTEKKNVTTQFILAHQSMSDCVFFKYCYELLFAADAGHERENPEIRPIGSPPPVNPRPQGRSTPPHHIRWIMLGRMRYFAPFDWGVGCFNATSV